MITTGGARTRASDLVICGWCVQDKKSQTGGAFEFLATVATEFLGASRPPQMQGASAAPPALESANGDDAVAQGSNEEAAVALGQVAAASAEEEGMRVDIGDEGATVVVDGDEDDGSLTAAMAAEDHTNPESATVDAAPQPSAATTVEDAVALLQIPVTDAAAAITRKVADSGSTGPPLSGPYSGGVSTAVKPTPEAVEEAVQETATHVEPLVEPEVYSVANAGAGEPMDAGPAELPLSANAPEMSAGVGTTIVAAETQLPRASAAVSQAEDEEIGGEEEEEVDILDIDEDEEAQVKLQMGVTEGGPGPIPDPDHDHNHEDVLKASLLDDDVLGADDLNGDLPDDLRTGQSSHLRPRRTPTIRDRMKQVADEDDHPGMEGLRHTRQRTVRNPQRKRRRTVFPDILAPLDVDEDHAENDHHHQGRVDEPPAGAAKLRRAAKGMTAGATSPTATSASRNQRRLATETLAKYCIKSFTVPEINVGVPESSTVGALKRAVMDASMQLLGGGLRVRVLLHGKRVMDEAATLAQAGITKASNLSFMLEPCPWGQASPNSTSGIDDPLLVLSQAAGSPSPRIHINQKVPTQKGRGKGKSKQPLQKQEHEDADFNTAIPGRGGKSRPPSVPPGSTPTSPYTTRVAAAHALAAIRAQAEAGQRVKAEEHQTGEALTPGTGAIVLHPLHGRHPSGLAMVVNDGTFGQLVVGEGLRRVRRPFTVLEVELLVDAVEKLGTGRFGSGRALHMWRDVKLRAFLTSKHRTYVDLKDKWKTLVRTAQIAPHQRRGEPVPQELLDRVTRAQAYWSDQIARAQAERDD
eukprot:SM000282S10599  [mRNA]  locus=s282:35915:39363:+ [translate_table: standard]